MQKVLQDDSRLQFVIFQVGAQNFAVEITRVKEIQRYQQPTPIPKSPAFLEGVIEVRGSLIPVVDLRKRFEISSESDRFAHPHHHLACCKTESRDRS